MPATRSRPRVGTIITGPWNGVHDTPDPFDAGPETLVDALNFYIPDGAAGSGLYQRPGFMKLNSVQLGVTPYRCAGVYTHTDLTGTGYNFLAISGKLYRVDSALATFTDVTPAGITIDAAPGNRVYFASLDGVMLVSDSVNRPWVASNLSSTPITGTYVSFDGGATTWAAFGQPVVYGGSGFMILSQVNSVGARLTVAWSEAGTWTTGYQQSGLDNTWTIEQTGTNPLYALCATNEALYYFRERSIGTIAGAVGPDLSSTATHDTISTNVGCTASATIRQYGDKIFFCDSIGRPYVLTQGSAPRPLWKQFRGVIDTAQTGFPLITAQTACAVIDPTLNKYIVGIWSYSPAEVSPTIELYNFDVVTEMYEGRWAIGALGSADGIYVDALGLWSDQAGRIAVIAVGSSASPTNIPAGLSGWVWGMKSVGTVGESLRTETIAFLETLVTEAGDALTTEGTPVTYYENTFPMWIEAETQPLGFETNTMLMADRISVLSSFASGLTITDTNSNVATATVGSPSSISIGADARYRFTLGCGPESIGRGIGVHIKPLLLTDAQYVLQQIIVQATPSRMVGDDG